MGHYVPPIQGGMIRQKYPGADTVKNGKVAQIPCCVWSVSNRN